MAAKTKRAGTRAALTFDTATFGHRVVTTPARTIAIASISTVSVGTDVAPKPKSIYLALALVSGAAAYAIYQSTQAPMMSAAILSPLALALAAIVFGAIALKPDDKTQYLVISTNDGLTTRFTGANPEFLEAVRDVLTSKIETGNESPTYAIYFRDGRIDTLEAPDARSRAPASQGHAYANGSINSAAQPGSALAAGHAQSPSPNGGHHRFANEESTQSALRAPAAEKHHKHGQIGNGHHAIESYVDFRNLLPAVVEMHRFYARQANTEHLEQRLSELELLMRSGAQTRSQKVRVRELTSDLSHILQAYQPAVQIFSQIASLAA